MMASMDQTCSTSTERRKPDILEVKVLRPAALPTCKQRWFRDYPSVAGLLFDGIGASPQVALERDSADYAL